MAFLNHLSVQTTSSLSTEVPKLFSSSGFSVNRKCCLTFGKNGSSFSSQKICLRLRESVIVAAKKNIKKHVKKEDTHSFVVRPDEATGPYPEAVLLKEKKVQEDGRLLPEFADDEERELFEQLTLELESDLDVDRMRHYEVVYMIHEDHVKEVESVNLKVQEFIKEKKGKLWRFSDWGLRRLAYKIKKARNAHYILVNFEFEAKWINDFKTMLDQDERVIRHLVIKKDKAETKDCPPPPEFHTIRAGMDDDNDDDVDDEIDIDDEYDDDDDIDDEYDDDEEEEEEEEEEEDIDDDFDDEDDGEEWDDEGEGEEDVVDGNVTEEGVIYVDDYIDDYMESKNNSKPSNVSSSKERMNLRPKKVGR